VKILAYFKLNQYDDLKEQFMSLLQGQAEYGRRGVAVNGDSAASALWNGRWKKLT